MHVIGDLQQSSNCFDFRGPQVYQSKRHSKNVLDISVRFIGFCILSLRTANSCASNTYLEIT